MARVKSGSEAVVVQGALAVMGQSPTAVERAWLDRFAGRSSAVITNVAGPREPVRLAGVPLAGFLVGQGRFSFVPLLVWTTAGTVASSLIPYVPGPSRGPSRP